MTDIYTEGKIKPAVRGGKVADFTDIDGEVGVNQVVAALRDGSIILADTDGNLPDPADNQGRFALTDSGVSVSRNHPADAVVTFKLFGPDRVVASGEPAISSKEMQYAGSFPNTEALPPIADYSVGAYLWSVSAQNWFHKDSQLQAAWRQSNHPGAPLVYNNFIYGTLEEAANHVHGVGNWQPNGHSVAIIGHGNSQVAYVLTAYTAPTSNNWQWDHLGISVADILAIVDQHNASGTAHQDIRSEVSTVEDLLDALDPLEIAAYDATATYSRGSANSIVTHSSGLFIYISSTQRSSGHDPDTQPGYWFELNEGVAYQVITSGSHRIAARTFVVDGGTDEVYLCTTTQTTPRDLAYIQAQAATIGGPFINLTNLIPTTWKGPHIVGQDYEAGDRVTTNANTRIYTARVDTGETPPHADWIQVGPVGQVGTGITETEGDARYARQSENLSDLDNASTARTNLGLGSAAEQPSSAFLTVDTGDARYLNEGSNLSDLPNAGTARTNLELGTAATRDTGTSENNVPILDASGDVDAAVVPIDDTLQVDGSGDLGVNTQRVVQTVSEWVQHFASGSAHDTSGHSGKYHEYRSSNTVRRIGSVQYDFTPGNSGGSRRFQVFIVELTGRNIDVILGSSEVYSGNNLQHRFHFTDGVTVNPNVRIGIGLHRTDGGNNETLSVRFGTESQDSPRESYDDASEDFNFVGRFNHDRPTPTVNDTVGGTTAGQIYGNPEIFYQIIHTHASLVGDGGVTASQIDSGSATADQPLLADGSGGTGFRDPVIHGGNLVDNTIPTAKYGNDSVTKSKLGANAKITANPSGTDGSDLERIDIGGTNYHVRSRGITHVQSGSATYDSTTHTITVAVTGGEVRGGDEVLFAVPSGIGSSSTQAVSLAIDGQASSTFPLHDRNGDALREDDLPANTVFKALSDADSWDILVLPVGSPGSGPFDLHEDVTTEISSLDDNDRFVVSDENLGGDPNRYVTLASVATKLAGEGLTASAGVLATALVDVGSDSSIAGVVNSWVLTDVNQPDSGKSWGFVNFGFESEYRRFKMSDFRALSNVVANNAASTANSLSFVVLDHQRVFIAPAAGNKVALAWDDASATPTSFDLEAE